MTIWFTADLHYGHAGIINHCKRPFSSVEEMNEILIKNYQELVEPGDDVYILGDFAMRKQDHERILKRLPGNKHLIIGNHDWNKSTKMTESHKELLCSWGYAWVKDTYLLRLRDFNGPKDHQYIWLTHYAHRTWPKRNKGSWHLYGHSHGRLVPEIGFSTDVGVDCWDYRPVNLSQIQKLFRLSNPPRCTLT